MSPSMLRVGSDINQDCLLILNYRLRVLAFLLLNVNLGHIILK